MKTLLTITDKDIIGYGKLSAAKPRIAVGIVLFDKGNNIAISYISNWGIHMLPGGGVDEGEDFIAAVKREALEETGCKCEIVGEIGMTYENRGKDDWAQEKYHYLAKVVGDKGELSLEDYEIASDTTVRWYPLGQAMQIISEQQRDDFYRWEFLKRRDMAVLEEVVCMMQGDM